MFLICLREEWIQRSAYTRMSFAMRANAPFTVPEKPVSVSNAIVWLSGGSWTFERGFLKKMYWLHFFFFLLWLLTAVYVGFFPTKAIPVDKNETSKTNACVLWDSLAVDGNLSHIKCPITASTKLAHHSYWPASLEPSRNWQFQRCIQVQGSHWTCSVCSQFGRIFV